MLFSKYFNFCKDIYNDDSVIISNNLLINRYKNTFIFEIIDFNTFYYRILKYIPEIVMKTNKKI